MNKPGAAPPVPPDLEIEITDEDEEVFASLGIDDDEQKKHAKILAASRMIAHRRLNKKPAVEPEPEPEKKPKWSPLNLGKGGKNKNG